MTEPAEPQKADRRPKKYLWFGYGNYGGQPNLQIGGGNVRDPRLFEILSDNRKTDASPMTIFMWVISAVIGLTMLVMLLAWAPSLILPGA